MERSATRKGQPPKGDPGFRFAPSGLPATSYPNRERIQENAMGKTLRRPARRPAPRRAAGAGESDATNRTIGLDDRLYAYLCRETLREPELMARLRAETSRLPRGTMQISPEQGQLMGLLVRLIGARRALEIGTFTGYSALAVAQALPADGKLICCDMSEEWTRMAQRYWR